MKTAPIDLFDPDGFVADVPHDAFAWIRANEPVYWNPMPDGGGFWNLTKYDDIVRASRDTGTFSSAKGSNIEDATGGAELMMVNMDPPQHTKLRTLVSKGFHPKIIASLEPYIRDIAASIVDGIARRGECDFVTDVAADLPLQVIAELMGVPREDRHKIFEWSNTMIGPDDPEYGNSMDDAMRAAGEMWEYANMLADLRRGEPRDDLVTTLVRAEVDGEQLTDIEFDMFFLLLAVAGNETTRNLISGGMLNLLRNPSERGRLFADSSLFAPAVEEMLRCVTPVMHFRRTATRDVEVRGTQIKAGDKVLLWYISANRDEEIFEDSMRFDAGRDPNPHVTFGGGGPHFCLGFALAQLEIKVVFEELLRRLADMELAEEPARLRSNFINGIKHMPVRFTPER